MRKEFLIKQNEGDTSTKGDGKGGEKPRQHSDTPGISVPVLIPSSFPGGRIETEHIATENGE